MDCGPTARKHAECREDVIRQARTGHLQRGDAGLPGGHCLQCLSGQPLLLPVHGVSVVVQGESRGSCLGRLLCFPFFPGVLTLFLLSQFSTLVLGNFGLWMLGVVALAAKRVFLGELRAQELELLADNIRPTIMSLLFFLTIFRTQFNATFISALVLLLFCKAAHWVAEARVNSMESSPSESNWTHVRLASLIAVLMFIDQSVVLWAAARTYTGGPSLLLLFGFEYCVLAVAAASMGGMFVLNLISIKRDQAWHAKGSYVLYLEFVCSAVQSLVYLCFFFIIFRYYGLPLHIIRSMYLTFASFQRSLAKLITYRRAVSSMDHRYPDATPEDLRSVDSICIVCRDEMEVGKKLPCGHILHLECLRSWLQQDPTCPLCRKSVLIEELYRGDQQTYAAEYARFLGARRGHAHHQHQHGFNQYLPHNAPHQPFNNGQQQQQQQQQPRFQTDSQQQQQLQQLQLHQDDRAELEAMRAQMDGLKSQLEFIQSLLITQIETQQQQQQEKKKGFRRDSGELDSPQFETEEEIRAKRLNFFKLS